MDRLFHIVGRDEWESAQAAGRYEPESLVTEGFIHLSTAEQLTGTANRFFSGRSDLVVLAIDPDAVGTEIRFEDLYDHGVEFPHLYGPLATSAVRDILALVADRDGVFTWPGS